MDYAASVAVELRPGNAPPGGIYLVGCSRSELSPSWLNRDTKQLAGNIQRLPERAEIDGFLNEQLIVEYYSR